VASGTPYLSVVVIFHKRLHFLREAVESVLSQSPAEEVEVLIVGPALPDPVADLLGSGKATFHECRDTSLGAKVARGIERARGEVIAFLEDDDRFAKGKVDRLLTRFRSNPRLGYFQNGFTPIDSRGRPFPGGFDKRLFMQRWSRVGQVTLTGRSVDHRFRSLASIPVSHNLSSISVRRGIVAGRTELVVRSGFAIDLSIFTIAFLASSFELVFDPTLLTELRVHDTLSNPLNQEELAIVSNLAWSGRHVLLQFVESEGTGDAARVWQGMTAVGDLNHYLRVPRAPRGEFGRLFVLGCSRWDTFAVRTHWPILTLSLLASLTPRLGHRAYLAVRKVAVALPARDEDPHSLHPPGG